MTSSVLCLNACSTPLKWIDWQRAVSMIVSDQAEVIETVDGEFVRSTYLSIPMPAVVMLRKYVYVPHVGRGGDPVDKTTRRAILTRDSSRCGYCGNPGDTIDHIFPRSRGGQDSWDNLITACLPCNQKKRDRTPEEASMPLLWPARFVDLRVPAAGAVQRRKSAV